MDSIDRTSSFIVDDSIIDLSNDSFDHSSAIGYSVKKKKNGRVIFDSDEENDSSFVNASRSTSALNVSDKSMKMFEQDLGLSSRLSSMSAKSLAEQNTWRRNLDTTHTSHNSSYDSFNSVQQLSCDDKTPQTVTPRNGATSFCDELSASNILVTCNLSPKLIEETDEEDDSVIEVLNDNSVFNVSSQSEDDLMPAIKTEEKGKQKVQSDIKSFMPSLPDSYPNSKKVYVKKEKKDYELHRLATLKEDLKNLRVTIEEINLSKLPDKGQKLTDRLLTLEKEVKIQMELVSNMVEIKDMPSEEDLKNDGFDLWEQIQKESVKVESKHHGKQGMNTHNIQMNNTLVRLKTMHEDLSTRPDEKTHIEDPKCLKVSLLPHQNQALAWLLWRESKFPHGGILADDMGLGKTFTMIALMARSKHDSEMNGDKEEDRWISRENRNLIRGGTLVVCPASLLSHWAREIEMKCKRYYFKVEVHHGNKREERPNKLSKADIVITTYNLISKDLDRLLGKIAWKRIILDEAHVVRNSKSLMAKSVCSLYAKYKWCLTGTPVHNKNLDLFALIQFLQCTPFDDLMVWKKWIDNKSAGAQERLSLITKCLMLRRTKEQLKLTGDLKDLPDKKYEEIEFQLTPQEMAVYQKVLVFSRTLFTQYLHQRVEKNADSYLDLSGKSQNEYFKMHKKLIALQGGKKIKSHEILVLLLRLRQICCHPGLIAAMLDPEDTGEAAGFEDTHEEQCIDLLSKLKDLDINENEEKESESNNQDNCTTAAEAMRSVLSSSNPIFDLKKPSSKMKSVFKCLHEKVFTKDGDKAVIVSQWTSMLSVFETHFKSEGIKCASITGNVPISLRSEVVEKFNAPNSDVQVLLLSLCAGGVGLNLVGGNHLLLVDLHWNPQLEVQAQDRIYRVGQKKPVYVYRFRCLGTIEQKIKQLQSSKLELAESVLTGAKHVPSFKLTLDDMKALLA